MVLRNAVQKYGEAGVNTILKELKALQKKEGCSQGEEAATALDRIEKALALCISRFDLKHHPWCPGSTHEHHGYTSNMVAAPYDSDVKLASDSNGVADGALRSQRTGILGQGVEGPLDDEHTASIFAVKGGTSGVHSAGQGLSDSEDQENI